MGIGGISIWQLLIILAIVLMLFGTKKLRNLGSDVGSAVKGFKDSMKEESTLENKTDNTEGNGTTIDGSVSQKSEHNEHKSS